MYTVLITGSNRGIGLALAQTYAQRGARVLATCRTPSSADDLQALAEKHADQVTILALDVTDTDAIATCVSQVSQTVDVVDVLINNAGIYPKAPAHTQLGALEADAFSQVLNVNSVAPIMMTQACLPLLRESENPRVVMVSSQMGSIERSGSSGFSYRVSKAAVNMAAKVLSNMLRAEDITVITTHPGHVATDMGGASAPVNPIDSAAGLANVIDGLTIDDTGCFYDYRGDSLPW